MHSEGHGLVRLGSDGFASAFLGRPDAIEVVVHAGAVVRGQPLAVLSRKGRRITLRSPLAGTLVERHDGLDAEQATADPFGHGWLATIRPDGDLLGGAARVAEQARAWMSSEWERVRALVANELRSPGAVGATLADGGSLQPGFLLHLDERQHVALERSCFDVAARATGFEVTDALASVGARLAQGSRS
jgi:glycine cleavage system H lipoate-binding protein